MSVPQREERDLGFASLNGRQVVKLLVGFLALMQMHMLILVHQVGESSGVPSPTTPERRLHADAHEGLIALSEAAAEALERYKRSAAAAATADERHAAGCTGNIEMQPGTAINYSSPAQVSSRPCTSPSCDSL